jgi:ribosome biogenesis GTPase
MQVLAANLDVLFVLCTFEGARGINLNRIDRYLSLFDSPKIQPVILVNKADLSPEPSAIYELFKRSGYACQVHAVSATQGIGMGELRKYFLGGKTGALVGPSGVGKTTILNVLTEAGGQKTAEVRSSDKRGRHTTSSRQLFVLAGGGILLDTPGLREVGVPANLDDGLLPFKTIEQYAHGCKFTNCRHHSEPGCAVLAAVRAQEITQEQYEHYLVLRAEKERHDGWHDEHVRRLRDEQWKKISAWSKRNKDPFGRKNNPWT